MRRELPGGRGDDVPYRRILPRPMLAGIPRRRTSIGLGCAPCFPRLGGRPSASTGACWGAFSRPIGQSAIRSSNSSVRSVPWPGGLSENGERSWSETTFGARELRALCPEYHRSTADSTGQRTVYGCGPVNGRIDRCPGLSLLAIRPYAGAQLLRDSRDGGFVSRELAGEIPYASASNRHAASSRSKRSDGAIRLTSACDIFVGCVVRRRQMTLPRSRFGPGRGMCGKQVPAVGFGAGGGPAIAAGAGPKSTVALGYSWSRRCGEKPPGRGIFRPDRSGGSAARAPRGLPAIRGEPPNTTKPMRQHSGVFCQKQAERAPKKKRPRGVLVDVRFNSPETRTQHHRGGREGGA